MYYIQIIFKKESNKSDISKTIEFRSELDELLNSIIFTQIETLSIRSL